MSDQSGSFDPHIDILYAILCHTACRFRPFYDKYHMTWNVIKYANMGIKWTVSIWQIDIGVLKVFDKNNVRNICQNRTNKIFLVFFGKIFVFQKCRGLSGHTIWSETFGIFLLSCIHTQTYLMSKRLKFCNLGYPTVTIMMHSKCLTVKERIFQIHLSALSWIWCSVTIRSLAKLSMKEWKIYFHL